MARQLATLAPGRPPRVKALQRLNHDRDGVRSQGRTTSRAPGLAGQPLAFSVDDRGRLVPGLPGLVEERIVETARVAMLIDCDNISHRAAVKIVAEASTHGTLSIRRAYGDFSSQRLAGWRKHLPALAIQPIQQFPYSVGKNATDSALIVDAMDLLYTTDTDVFCIVSSDSDFTRLATRLRESGKRVYGIGARTTPVAFKNACDRFTYLDLLTGETDEPDERSRSDRRRDKSASAPAAEQPPESEEDQSPEELPLPDLSALLSEAIQATAGDDGWAALSSVGWYIVNNHPTFDSRSYGYPKLSRLVRDQPGINVKVRTDDAGRGQIWITTTEPD